MSRGEDPPRLSVILITRDEEQVLPATLESVAWADEIVVVDSGSTDRTEEIVRRYTDRFIVREWEGWGPQKQRALEAATGEWVLSVDADEAVSPELAESIRRAIRSPGPFRGFEMELHLYDLGTWIGRRGWSRDWKLRLFRRDAARFSDPLLHEAVVVDGPVGRLEGPLLHHRVIEIAEQVEKMNRYTTLAARDKLERGRRSGTIKPFVMGLGWFIKSYLLRGGFLHGGRGLLRAGFQGIYNFLRYAKIWELGESRSRPEAGEHLREVPGKARREDG